MNCRDDATAVASGQALGQLLEVLDEAGVAGLRGDEEPASPSEALLARFERFLL